MDYRDLYHLKCAKNVNLEGQIDRLIKDYKAMEKHLRLNEKKIIKIISNPSVIGVEGIANAIIASQGGNHGKL